MRDLFIVGAGGFGREAIWTVERINALSQQPQWNIIGYADDDPKWKKGDNFEGFPILGTIEEASRDYPGASVFIAISVLLFAFLSVLGWNLYGKATAVFLFGEKSKGIYLISSLFFIFSGAVMPVKTVWLLTDIFNSLMVLTNVPALIRLSGKTREFLPRNIEKRQKQC